jgi:hypothetical protein
VFACGRRRVVHVGDKGRNGRRGSLAATLGGSLLLVTAEERKEVSRRMNEARTAKLSPEKRSEIAKQAAAVRYRK